MSNQKEGEISGKRHQATRREPPPPLHLLIFMIAATKYSKSVPTANPLFRPRGCFKLIDPSHIDVVVAVVVVVVVPPPTHPTDSLPLPKKYGHDAGTTPLSPFFTAPPVSGLFPEPFITRQGLKSTCHLTLFSGTDFHKAISRVSVGTVFCRVVHCVNLLVNTHFNNLALSVKWKRS